MNNLDLKRKSYKPKEIKLNQEKQSKRRQKKKRKREMENKWVARCTFQPNNINNHIKYKWYKHSS